MTSPTSCLPCILGAFQALRIPSPGFLSSFLLSLPSFALSFLPSAAVEPVVLRRCVWKKKKKKRWLSTCAGITAGLGVRFSRLCSVVTFPPPQPPPPHPFPFKTRVLYHQLYHTASQCDEGNKTAISLWSKWINIPSAGLFRTRLSGHIERLKSERFSTGFLCKANIDLWPVFWCIMLADAVMNATVPYWFFSLPQSLLNMVKRANEIWISHHPYTLLIKGLK